MSEALFYDPAVLRVVRAILVDRGIRSGPDLEDAIGNVVLAAIEFSRKQGTPPKNVAHAIAMIRPIANRHGITEGRKRARRGPINLGSTESADDHAAPPPSIDPAELERMGALIRQVLKADEIEVMADVGAGVEQKELAAERNISAAAMRKRTQTSRAKVLDALSAHGYWVAGGFAALLAVFVAVYVGVWRDSDVVAHGHSPRELAEQERREALYACKEQQWDACERALDRAAQLDEPGDREAEVLEMRAAIAAGRRGLSLDGGGDSP